MCVTAQTGLWNWCTKVGLRRDDKYAIEFRDRIWDVYNEYMAGDVDAVVSCAEARRALARIRKNRTSSVS